MHQRRSREHEFGVRQLLACSLGRPGLEVFESVLPFKSSNTNFSCGSLKYLETYEVVGEPFGGCCRSRQYIDGSAQLHFEKCRNLLLN